MPTNISNIVWDDEAQPVQGLTQLQPQNIVWDEPEPIARPTDITQISEQFETPSDMGILGTVAEKARGVGEFLGLEKATEPFAKAAARVATGLEGVPRETIEEAIPKPTAGELVGGGLQIGALFIPYGQLSSALAKGFGGLAPKAIASALGTAGAGATGGFAIEAGEKIQRGEAPTPGLTTAIGAIAPVAIPAVARKLLPRPVDKALNQSIKHGITKGIRPSIPEVGKTAVQSKAYYKKAQNAVESIIDNKANLQLSDEFGEITKNQLPKSLNQFSEAISQTKKNIFAQYDDLARQAGVKGAKVDLTPIADELNKIPQNKVLVDLNPGVIKYAETKAATLTNRRSYTTLEAQEAVTALNDGLKAFYANPSYDTASKAYIDALIANKMRESLDDVIEKTTAAGYQALKNQYGALKTIEKDVTKRALVDARKNIKGLVDFSDVISSGVAMQGILSTNPATIGAAATSAGMSAWIKRINDPNNIVKNMFKQSEKLIERGTRELSRKPVVKPRFPGDVIAEELTPLAKKIKRR